MEQIEDTRVVEQLEKIKCVWCDLTPGKKCALCNSNGYIFREYGWHTPGPGGR